MIQLNIVLCIIEPSYLQYLTSRDVRDSISPLATEESTSYMDVPKPYSTWWLHKNMEYIPMRSEFFLCCKIPLVLALSQGRNRSAHFSPSPS